MSKWELPVSTGVSLASLFYRVMERSPPGPPSPGHSCDCKSPPSDVTLPLVHPRLQLQEAKPSSVDLEDLPSAAEPIG